MSTSTLIAGSLLVLMISTPALATCSAEPMMASICITAANFCPRGYLPTNGQILSISQNSALFALLGTTYGGNGVSTFALPNLQSRVPVGAGQGPGLNQVVLGEVAGQEHVTILPSQMPPHTHSAQLKGSAGAGNTDSPAGAVPAKLARSNIYSNGAASDNMSASAIAVGSAGGGQPVDVRNPFVGLNYCIAIQGIFPSRD
jgi:microcystin-dependent protein